MEASKPDGQQVAGLKVHGHEVSSFWLGQALKAEFVELSWVTGAGSKSPPPLSWNSWSVFVSSDPPDR